MQFICKLDNFPLMYAADKVWVTDLTLIHKSVRNSHAQINRSIWRKAYYNVSNKNNNVNFEGLDRHYHKYPTRNIVLAEILTIMSVPTFKTAIILYIVRYLDQYDVIN